MWYIAIEENTDYLAHHGIKGQRWGIRRFQNEDGSLTPDGLKRYKTDKNGFLKSKKRRAEYGKLIDQQIAEKQKIGGNKYVQSTGKNWDSAHDYIQSQISKLKTGENSIFSNKTPSEVSTIFGEIYTTAALKDVGYSKTHEIKKRLATNPEYYNETEKYINTVLLKGVDSKYLDADSPVYINKNNINITKK